MPFLTPDPRVCKSSPFCPRSIWDRFGCIYLDDSINEKEMGKACATYGTDQKCIQDFGWESWKRTPV